MHVRLDVKENVIKIKWQDFVKVAASHWCVALRGTYRNGRQRRRGSGLDWFRAATRPALLPHLHAQVVFISLLLGNVTHCKQCFLMMCNNRETEGWLRDGSLTEDPPSSFGPVEGEWRPEASGPPCLVGCLFEKKKRGNYSECFPADRRSYYGIAPHMLPVTSQH